MNTKTLSILFALVMVLSMSAGVFAQDFTETWDEETVLTVFNDLDIMFPDLFADIDSDFLFVDNDDVAVIPSEFPMDGDEFAAKDLTLEDLEAKAPIDASGTAKMEASFSPCGDGLIKFDVTLQKAADESGTASNYYGPNNTTYIRSIAVTVDGAPAQIKKCSSTGGDNCRSVKFNGKGVAHLTGYIYAPVVYAADATPAIEMTITHSTYMTALWDVEKEADIVVSATATANTKSNYCQASLQEYELGGLTAVRARYDENTGEARFQATIRNYKSTDKVNYAIPAEVAVPINVYAEDGSFDHVEYDRYTDYTCKYTVFNQANAAPRTDYCKFGEGIALAPNAVIRFDITIDNLSSAALLEWNDDGMVPFFFRVGGMTYLVGTSANTSKSVAYDGQWDVLAAFLPVDFPCPVVSRMSVMDPLKPFMTFYGMETDDAIEPSGAYGVYEGGVWGLYQKCGKFAYMAVRLKNDGIQDETVNLKNVAVAINGGTPMDWKWVLTSVPESEPGKIELAPGEDVVLFLRAKVTDATWQLNSDIAMTGAVNFLDYGFYISGKIYSDHNNTNCTVAP